MWKTKKINTSCACPVDLTHDRGTSTKHEHITRDYSPCVLRRLAHQGRRLFENWHLLRKTGVLSLCGGKSKRVHVRSKYVSHLNHWNEHCTLFIQLSIQPMMYARAPLLVCFSFSLGYSCIPHVQRDWGLPCDHGLDHASYRENNNNNNN